MNYKEIKKISDSELADKIIVEEKYLMKLRFAHVISPIENPMKIRQTRRNIARLKTAQATKLNN